MPKRKPPLINGQVYHVFNRGSNKQRIFIDLRDYKRAMSAINYYQHHSNLLRLSNFFFQSKIKRTKELDRLCKTNVKRVRILCFCLMPNHYHFLLQQISEGGISYFIKQFQSSYAHYFNKKNNKTGSVFEGRFKAVRVEDENQLIHVSRYIHLNPYSAFLVKKPIELNKYPWSSLTEYIDKNRRGFCETKAVLSEFKNKKDYHRFVLNCADDKNSLKVMKELALDAHRKFP